ncbi:MAG: HAD-IC family P-type ATPase [Solirubrobacteraceae bacterium]
MTSASPRSTIEAPWAVAAGDVVAELAGSPEGLTSDEARARLARDGPNAVEQHAATPRLVVLARQFRSPLIYILLVAALVTVALGEYVDAGVIAVVLVINAIIGYVEETRAERSVDALRRLASTSARVLRDRREIAVDATHLVVGDVVLLEAGAKAPADCRILHATSLEADESLLTGESVTAGKSARPVDPHAGAADRSNMLHMGTVVTRGHARAVVVATGRRTELGRIAGSVQQIRLTETPLQRRMGRFTRLVGGAALAASALGFVLGVARDEDAQEMFLAMVALAVAALPEGLPIVMTVVLAISVSRMAARRAIVRHLPAVETLGSCTVIGSDKTGTLTQNRMTVEAIHAGGRRYEVTGGGYEIAGAVLDGDAPADLEADEPLRMALLAGALCNEAAVIAPEGAAEFEVTGDPTEIALLIAAAKAGLYVDELTDELPRTGDIPFDSETRYAASFHQQGDATLVLVKGAPERVLDMCATAAGGLALDRRAVLEAAHALARRGLRVLAMAYAQRPGGHRDDARDLVFAGLQGMMDPPREEAHAAVTACRRAGIRPLMITGDHAATALAIARQLGIAGEDDRVLTGHDLERIDERELERTVREVSVYARASPEHKLRLVQALQRNGAVVAVTGDGVNDAPALKAADIGAAMGRSGTDVAKEAADMVVTDDDFATIVDAVREGRVAFDNVRNTTFFLISGNAATVLAVLVSIAFQFPLPFVAVQLLWLNLVTNGVQDIALAFEPGEDDVLDRAPRPPREGVISRLLWERTVLAAIVMAAGTLLLFLTARDAGEDLAYAQTLALTTMVVFQAVHVGNCRSEYGSAFRKSLFSNRFLLIGTVSAVLIHVGAIYLPFTQQVLHLEPLALGDWVTIAAVALSVIAVVELHKLVRRDPDRVRVTADRVDAHR